MHLLQVSLTGSMDPRDLGGQKVLNCFVIALLLYTKQYAAAAKSLQSCPTLCDPRLRRPWDSPGKNTGVGCHFRLQCVKVKSESEVAQLCPTLSDPMD